MSRTDFEAAYIERYGHRPRGWNDDFQVYQDAHANGAWFGWQARAAGIEAKAAPVGEREAAIDWYNNADWGNECFKDGVVRGFQAGAAHQRQQAREVVMPDDLSELLVEIVDIHRRRGVVLTIHIEQIADMLARLNKGGSHE